MLLIIILFFIFIFIVISRSCKINIPSKRILYLYVGYWGLTIILSSIGVGNLNRPSNFTFTLLLLSLAMFVSGFMLLKRSKSETTMSTVELKQLLDTFIDSKTFLFLLVIATITSLSYFSIMQSALAYTNSLSEVREMYFDGSMFGNRYVWLNYFFLEPMHYICLPLFGYMLLFRRNWKFLLITVFLLSYVSLGGGRFGYLRMAFGVLFILFCMFNDIHLKAKQWIILILSLCSFIYIVGMVTSARSSGNESVAQEAVSGFTNYLCGSLSALDYAINYDYIDQLGGYQLGKLTFSSIDGIFKYANMLLGFNYDDSLARLVEMKQNTTISIGDGKSWNALYTGVLFYWLDGGFLGCIIFPFILGMLFRFIVRQFYRFRTWPFFVLVAMFYQINMHMVSDFKFTSPFTLIVVVLLYIIGKKRIEINRIA